VTGSRTFTAALRTALGLNSITEARLLELHFDSVIYLTDHGRDVVYDGNSYISGADLISVPPIAEQGEPRVNSTRLELTGVSAAYRSLFLAGDHIDLLVIVRVAAFDSSDALTADPYVIFDGRVQGFDLVETTKSAIVTPDVASRWADWDKFSAVRTNNHSQQIHYPNDTGMRHAAPATLEVLWGRT